MYIHMHVCIHNYNIHVCMCSYRLYNYFTACDLSTFCPIHSHFDFKLKLDMKREAYSKGFYQYTATYVAICNFSCGNHCVAIYNFDRHFQ